MFWSLKPRRLRAFSGVLRQGRGEPPGLRALQRGRVPRGRREGRVQARRQEVAESAMARLQLLFKVAGTENMLILVVNVLAVNVLAIKFGCITVPKSVLLGTL